MKCFCFCREKELPANLLVAGPTFFAHTPVRCGDFASIVDASGPTATNAIQIRWMDGCRTWLFPGGKAEVKATRGKAKVEVTLRQTAAGNPAK